MPTDQLMFTYILAKSWVKLFQLASFTVNFKVDKSSLNFNF